MALYKSPYAINAGKGTINANPAPITDPANILPKNEEQACVARGGIWDANLKTCIMPSKQETPSATTTKTPTPPPAQPEAIRNEQGALNGVSLPNGSIYPNMRPEDIAQQMKLQQAKTQLPQGMQEQGTAQNIAINNERLAQLTQMAAQGMLTPQELQAITGNSIDVGQAAGAGLMASVPTAIGGAVAGATAGAIAGSSVPIAGTLIGAGAGAIGGFLVAMRGNIKEQQSESFAADQAALSKGQMMLRGLITDTNQHPENAAENIQLFYQTLNMIDAAHAKTWKDSQENLNRFLGNDGTEQLAKFEVFNSTMRQFYIQRFNTALAQPNPGVNMVTADDLAEFSNE